VTESEKTSARSARTVRGNRSRVLKLHPARTGHGANRLAADLRSKVVGQDEAINQLVSMYQTYLAGMNSPGRPVGNLLFLGPTGSGKTRLAEVMAESVAGKPRTLLKVDCAEFQHSHEIAKLVGSPPGYLGHRETRPGLSQQVLNQHYTDKVKISFVLFDEIEKASDALWNLLLGILDKGVLTLGDNQKVDFSQSIIFMTSNLGAAEMDAIARPKLGFGAGEVERKRLEGRLDPDVNARVLRAGVAAAHRKFSPEFINRIDRVLVFRPLGQEQLRRILDLEVRQIQERILAAGACDRFEFYLTASAKDYLLLEGTDIRYGARHLKRALERELVYPLSNLIASGQVRGGDVIRVSSTRSEGLMFCNKIVPVRAGAAGGCEKNTGGVADGACAPAAASRRTSARKRVRSAGTAS
jgi:ATP-dependent Clp protease ATP-binding subunit ClpB